MDRVATEGKTRMTAQVGHKALVDYPDGGWLIELAPLAEAHLEQPDIRLINTLYETLGHGIKPGAVYRRD